MFLWYFNYDDMISNHWSYIAIFISQSAAWQIVKTFKRNEYITNLHISARKRVFSFFSFLFQILVELCVLCVHFTLHSLSLVSWRLGEKHRNCSHCQRCRLVTSEYELNKCAVSLCVLWKYSHILTVFLSLSFDYLFSLSIITGGGVSASEIIMQTVDIRILWCVEYVACIRRCITRKINKIEIIYRQTNKIITESMLCRSIFNIIFYLGYLLRSAQCTATHTAEWYTNT